MWAIVVNEKIIEVFEDYEEARDELFDLFFDGVKAKLRKIEKEVDN